MKHQIMTFLIINALPPTFLQKRFPLLFSVVHLLHRLYGVDAPVYDIRPGNGAGQFLQPRSPHGALGV